MKKLELKNIKKHTMKPSFLMALVQYVIHQSQAALWENQGAGKTTLLNIIMGLVSADSGMAGYSFQSGSCHD